MKEKESKEKNIYMSDAKKSIIKNSIITILLIIGFVGIYIGYLKLQDAMFTRIWQIITMAILGCSIIIFEVAYKKDSGTIAINGIEVFIFACFVLTLEYIKTRFHIDVKMYVTIAGIIYGVYYILKAFVIYTNGRKKELNSFSDIAEIVKEEEPQKKEAVKRKKGVGEK